MTLADVDLPVAGEDVDSATTLAELAIDNHRRRRWIVVLDDDPTGTQTVRDVPIVLGDWSADDLDWASEHHSKMTVVLTNSRSLDPDHAVELTVRAVTECAAVAKRRAQSLMVVSRSDSTLRGHFSRELVAATETLAECGFPAAGVVFAPCFLEAGRYTAKNVQWVESPRGELLPAAGTEFARDPMFGYTEHRLDDWIARQLPEARVSSYSLADLRRPDAVSKATHRLRTSAVGDVHLVNCVRPDDLITFVCAAYAAAGEDKSFLYRTGPTALRILAGQPAAAPLTSIGRSRHDENGHGLVVVGSHTALTNRQLHALTIHRTCTTVELNVVEVLAGHGRAAEEVRRCVDESIAALAGSLTVLQTTRDTVHPDHANPLRTTRTVAAAVNEVVRRTCTAVMPRFLLAKGGITSHDLAAVALGATRAEVLGQLFDGHVSVWRLHNGQAPELPYVVFPGNVGDDDALTAAVSALTQKALP